MCWLRFCETTAGVKRKMLVVRFHIDRVSVLATEISRLHETRGSSRRTGQIHTGIVRNHAPNMPLGATMVSLPNTCFAVPAMSSNALASSGVIGAGSRPTFRLTSRVMCEGDLGVSVVKGEMVKLSFLARGTRRSETYSRVSLIDEVLRDRQYTNAGTDHV